MPGKAYFKPAPPPRALPRTPSDASPRADNRRAGTSRLTSAPPACLPTSDLALALIAPPTTRTTTRTTPRMTERMAKRTTTRMTTRTTTRTATRTATRMPTPRR